MHLKRGTGRRSTRLPTLLASCLRPNGREGARQPTWSELSIYDLAWADRSPWRLARHSPLAGVAFGEEGVMRFDST